MRILRQPYNEYYTNEDKAESKNENKAEGTESVESKTEGKAESAESVESKAEGSAESSAEGRVGMFSVKDIIEYVIKQLWQFLLSLPIAFAIFFFIRNKNMKIWKKGILIISPVIISLIYLYYHYMAKPRSYYFLSIIFGEQPIKSDWKHTVGDKGWSFSGSAVLVMNGKNYIFVGNGEGNDDALLLYNPQTKKLDNVISKYNISDKSASYSAVSIDIDNDGLTDLIVGRDDGVTLYKQTKFGNFKKIKLTDKQDRVPLGLSISDYNVDGKTDLYISYFTKQDKYRGTVFNDSSHNRENVLLKNISKEGKIEFTDVTAKLGAGGKYNTFTSAFIDINNDGFPDLVLSNDSGPIEVLENREGKGFNTTMPHNALGNYMGLGIGDIDQDGDLDLFLTNLGEDISRDKLSKGDVRSNQKQEFKHVLLKNNGDFKFVDIINKSGSKEMKKGFGWGGLLKDLNNDSRIDLLFAENFLLNPSHWLFGGVGRQFMQNKEGKFKRSFDYKNPNFGQSPMFLDLDKDGIKDIIWINMGGPILAYLNKSKNNFVNVILPKNSLFLNAKIVLETMNGKKFYKELIIGGQGLGSDTESGMISFGLGKSLVPKMIRVYLLNGTEYSVKSPKINSTLLLKQLKLEK